MYKKGQLQKARKYNICLHSTSANKSLNEFSDCTQIRNSKLYSLQPSTEKYNHLCITKTQLQSTGGYPKAGKLSSHG